MKNFNNHCKIKIPKNVEFFYCDKKQFIVIKSSLKTLHLFTNFKIKLRKKTLLEITNCSFYNKNCGFNKKNLQNLKKISRFLLLQKLNEALTNFCVTLKINGIGFRFLSINFSKLLLFQLKIGFSHKTFVKSLESIQIINDNLKLYVAGKYFQKVTQVSSIIRALKKPDPYKGKGISYENEKLKLKQGKKI